jgi:hypothetical protein
VAALLTSHREIEKTKENLRIVDNAAKILISPLPKSSNQNHHKPLKDGAQTASFKDPVRFPIVTMEFFIDIILPAALWRLG